MANPAVQRDYPAILGELLPLDLLELPRWLVWKRVQRGKGKPTKVPYSALTGRKASVTNPQTWAAFGQACEAYASGAYTGLGFVLGDGICGVDLDTCRDPDTGLLAPWALALVRELASYTEVSPSGTGVHILIRGELPAGSRRRGQVEMYATERFLTVTGERLADMPRAIEERTGELAAIHARIFAPDPAPASSRPAVPAPSSPALPGDTELILKAHNASNGAAFGRLWAGDIGGYTSASEADMALCARLAFWTGPDAGRIDRLYRQSGLYADRARKWDRKLSGTTYGARTIERVLASPRDYYTPRATPRGAMPAPAWAPDREEGEELAPGSPARIEEGPADRKAPRAPRRRAPRGGEDDSGNGGEGEGELLGALPLCDTRYGPLAYADNGEDLGIYLLSARGQARCILGARIDILRIDAPEATGRGSQVHAVLTSPLWPDRPLSCIFTHETALSGRAFDENGLAGMLQNTPTGKAECELAWKGIRALAALAAVTRPEVRTRLVRSLGWHEGVWVRVNGHIDRAGAHTGGAIVAAVREDWPQTIPGDPGALPAVVDASIIRRLLTFWPDEVTLFPLAMLGACASIMRPYTDGRARWELELFGNSDWLKTTFCNWTLRAFYGAGYSYTTGTQLTGGKAGDTGIGRLGTRAALRYHAYLTYDYDQKPGMPDYEAQQNERIQSAMDTGNDRRGGARGTRDGGIDARPNPQGLLIRTGEADPHEYTLRIGKDSADARCVTYVLEGSSLPGKGERMRASEELDRRAGELDTLAILHTRWLASLDPEEAQAQWDRIRASAARLVASEELTGAYPFAHSRAREQCEDIAAGLISYCLFLRAVDSEAGTFARAIREGLALSEELKARIPDAIRERLAASDSLMRAHHEARGGDSAREASAAAFLAAIREELTTGAYQVTNQACDGPAFSLPVGPEYAGWERYSYTTRDSAGDPRTIIDWRPRARTIPLACEADKGRYLACDDTALETLARAAAKSNRRIVFISLDRLKRDLLDAGIIQGAGDGKHIYTRQIRLGDGAGNEARRWRVFIPVDRIWPDASGEEEERAHSASAHDGNAIPAYIPFAGGDSGDSGDSGDRREADSASADGLRRGEEAHSGEERAHTAENGQKFVTTTAPLVVTNAASGARAHDGEALDSGDTRAGDPDNIGDPGAWEHEEI